MNFLGKILDSLHLNFLNCKDSPSYKAKRDININLRNTKDAPNVYFRMTRNYIVDYPPDKSHFGELKTPVTQNCDVSRFEFIDIYSEPIGRCTRFQKLREIDTELIGYYRIEDKDAEKTFLETLNEQKGYIYAKVGTTSGDQFIYTYRALQDNWKKTLEESHPNLNDEFNLENKESV